MPANLENSAVATGLEKVSVHSNPKERQCQRMFKLLHNCTHLNASKVMLKILQARLQQHVNCELTDVQAGFEKAEESEIKLPTSVGSPKKQESSRKTSTSVVSCLQNVGTYTFSGCQTPLPHLPMFATTQEHVMRRLHRLEYFFNKYLALPQHRLD